MLIGVIIVLLLAILTLTGALNKPLRETYTDDFVFLALCIVVAIGIILPPIPLSQGLTLASGGCVFILALIIMSIRSIHSKLYSFFTLLVGTGISFLIAFLINNEVLSYATAAIVISVFTAIFCEGNTPETISTSTLSVAIAFPIAAIIRRESFVIFGSSHFTVMMIVLVASYVAMQIALRINLNGRSRRRVSAFEVSSIEKTEKKQK